MRPVPGSLPVDGDVEFAFALKDLQGIGRLADSFLFADRKDFVLEVGFTHVEQRLARSWPNR